MPVKELRLQVVLFLGMCALLFPNLGLMPYLADEPTRTIPALEMAIRGNYTVLTIHGEPYLNKLPLFYWLMYGVFQLTGASSEFVARLLAVLPLIGFAVHIWAFLRRAISPSVGFFTAVAFVTSGRMWLYDSQLAHIDILYSYTVFLSFLAFYRFGRRGQWGYLFWSTYGLMTAGILFKGLPSIPFQGLTLLATLAYFRAWPKLFHRQHVLAGFFWLGVLGAYFYAYSQQAELEPLLAALFSQGSQRTFWEQGLWATLLHLTTFPLEHLFGHLLPWGLLAAFTLHRPFWREVKRHPLWGFFGLVLLVNIPVYWLSPETYPRYVFMLYPITLGMAVWAYFQYRAQLRWLDRSLWALLGGLAALLALGAWAIPMVAPQVADVPNISLISVMLSVGMAGGAYAFWRWRHQWLYGLVAVLLVVRVAHNQVIIPERYLHSEHTHYRKWGHRLGSYRKKSPIYLQGATAMKHDIVHYYTEAADTLLPFAPHGKPMAPGNFLVVNPARYAQLAPYLMKRDSGVQALSGENRLIYLAEVVREIPAMP